MGVRASRGWHLPIPSFYSMNCATMLLYNRVNRSKMTRWTWTLAELAQATYRTRARHGLPVTVYFTAVMAFAVSFQHKSVFCPLPAWYEQLFLLVYQYHQRLFSGY